MLKTSLTWILALTLLASAARGEEAGTEVGEPSRPFISSTLSAAGQFGLSPVRLRPKDAWWLVPSALAVGVALNNDIPVYHAMATGDARKPWLDETMPVVSFIGEGVIEFVLVGAAHVLGGERLKKTSATALQGLLVSGIWSPVFKYAAWSNRPYVDDQEHRFWDYNQSTTGFPSGHSFSAFTLAEIFGAEYGRWFTYPLAGVIAYSRIYNQKHWPSDVVAGSILGIILGVQMNRLTDTQGPPVFRMSTVQRDQSTLLAAHLQF